MMLMTACAGSPSAPFSSDRAQGTLAAPKTARGIDWSMLSGFAWWPEDPDQPTSPPAIPHSVLALDGQEIEIEAELAPIVWGEDAIQGFVLTRAHNTCCVCVLPPFTEWIEILDIDHATAEQRIYATTRLRGRLSVGPVRDQFGYVRSFYRLSEARFIDPPLNRG